jgi:hypothetical protein
MIDKIPVCISSVYVKEESFKYLRSMAKDIIDKHPFLIGIRNPEDVKTQEQFDKNIGESFALILILGSTQSKAVTKEMHLALERDIPVIPLIQTSSTGKKIKPSNAVKKLLDHVDWNFENTKIYFSEPDDFKEILEQQIKYKIINRIKLNASVYPNRIDVYDSIIESLDMCRKRCVIAQKTPTIFLGPKNYDPRDKKLFIAQYNLLKKVKEGKLGQLLIFFNHAQTRDAINDIKTYKEIEFVKKTVLPLLLSIKNNIDLRVTNGSLSPFIITDHNFIYKLELGISFRYMVLPTAILNIDQIKEVCGFCETMGDSLSMDSLLSLY